MGKFVVLLHLLVKIQMKVKETGIRIVRILQAHSLFVCTRISLGKQMELME